MKIYKLCFSIFKIEEPVNSINCIRNLYVRRLNTSEAGRSCKHHKLKRHKGREGKSEGRKEEGKEGKMAERTEARWQRGKEGRK